ncbi:MAG TPA: hypothetical protein VFQ45_03940 [Longimicrobium sp.]|nr:hypothetical protein [Longimicrobium sp.]
MRAIVLTAALLAAAVPAAAQHQHGGQQQKPGAHADHAAHGGLALPAGWQVRLDRAGANAADIHFMEMDGTWHVVSGPAAIFYNADSVASGAFRAEATFTQNKPSNHPEAYGLIVGGRNLAADNQDYLYFVIRQDGRFLVKHRAGTETHTLQDWTEHAAVVKPGADGKAVNQLAIASGDFGASFFVNGQQVFNIPPNVHLNTAGNVGLRVNHNLDVAVSNFSVTRN